MRNLTLGDDDDEIRTAPALDVQLRPGLASIGLGGEVLERRPGGAHRRGCKG